MIPDAVFTVLARFVGLEASLEDAIAAPRVHTEGGLDLTVERNWPAADVEFLRGLGYVLKSGNSANVHAISVSPRTGACRSAAR